MPVQHKETCMCVNKVQSVETMCCTMQVPTMLPRVHHAQHHVCTHLPTWLLLRQYLTTGTLCKGIQLSLLGSAQVGYARAPSLSRLQNSQL